MLVKDLYYKKYLKYKNKYLNLLSQLGGTKPINTRNFLGMERKRDSSDYENALDDAAQVRKEYSNPFPKVPTIVSVIPIYSIDGLQAMITWKQDRGDLNYEKNDKTFDKFDYYISSTPVGVQNKFIYQSSENEITAFVGGLNDNQEYIFQVRAYTEDGRSNLSNPSKPIKILTNIPSQPIINNVTMINNEAEIKWDFKINYGGGLQQTTYKIFINNQHMKDVDSTLNHVIIKNIPSATLYVFTIIATNRKGSSNRSKPFIVKVDKVQEQLNPNLPKFVNVIYGNKCASVQWTINDFGCGNIRYKITFFADGASNIEETFNSPSTNSTNLIKVFNNLENDKKYSVKLEAIQLRGSSEAYWKYNLASYLTRAYPHEGGKSFSELNKEAQILDNEIIKENSEKFNSDTMIIDAENLLINAYVKPSLKPKEELVEE